MPALERELIEQAIENAGVDLTIHERYSGRWMYGSVCLGVSGSSRALQQFILELHSLEPVLARCLSNDTKTDSLGLDRIWYFPSYTLKEES